MSHSRCAINISQGTIQVTGTSLPHCGPRHGKKDYRLLCVQCVAGSLPLVSTVGVSSHGGSAAGAPAKKLTKGSVEEPFCARS